MSNQLVKGNDTAELLFRAVQVKWYNASPRVKHWLGTIGEAYQAVIDGDENRLINLPTEATTKSGETKDKAINILIGFNDWLGRDIVWRCLDTARESNGDLY
jgi:hypothetical protein